MIFGGGSTGGRGRGAAAPMKNVAPSAPPHFGPASLDFHLNKLVISLIQLQNSNILNSAAYCDPRAPSWNCGSPFPPPHLTSARTAPDDILLNVINVFHFCYAMNDEQLCKVVVLKV